MTGVRERRVILVVDDDEVVQEAVCATLQDAGYATVCAADGAEALEYLRTHDAPALILLDLWMPRMDGWTFFELRRKDPDLAGVPVVVVSARGGPARLNPYVGVEALLAKPVSPNALLLTVDRYRARGPARRRRQTG